MPGWNGLKILMVKHMWKSKIRLLEQKKDTNRYDAFFWCTLYVIDNTFFIIFYTKTIEHYIQGKVLIGNMSFLEKPNLPFLRQETSI